MRVTIMNGKGEPVVALSDGWPWLNQRHGWFLLKDGIEGVFEPTTPKEETISLPQQHGDYWPSRLTMSKRVVTLRALYSARSSLDRAQAQDLLNSLAAQHLTLVFEDERGRRSIEGFISQGTSPSISYHGLRLRFSLIITCPQPFFLGAPASFTADSGRIMAENTGNAPAWPRVHATSVSSLALSFADSTVSWEGTRGTLDLDFRDMIPSRGTVLSDDAFALPPGTSLISIRTNQEATVNLLLQPAWK
jgi:hypothetical protein